MAHRVVTLVAAAIVACGSVLVEGDGPGKVTPVIPRPSAATGGASSRWQEKLRRQITNNETEASPSTPSLLVHPSTSKAKRFTASIRLAASGARPQGRAQRRRPSQLKPVAWTALARGGDDNEADSTTPAFLELESVDGRQGDVATGSVASLRHEVALRAQEMVCQRRMVREIRDGVYREVKDDIGESVLSTLKTENIVKGIIMPIGECIAYGIVKELANVAAEQFVKLFEPNFMSIVPDGIQMLFGPLLSLYLLKGLGRNMAMSVSDALEIFLNRDLVEIITVLFMGYLSSQGDPQLQHVVTHVVTDVIAKGTTQAITHSLTHGITHSVTHTVTHEVIHHYYCIYCHYYNQYCNLCYHYNDDPTMHRLFQVSVAD